MPKKGEKVEEVESTFPPILDEKVQETNATTSSRESRWEKFLEKAQIQNPIKFAQKKAKGEFNKIPDSFR